MENNHNQPTKPTTAQPPATWQQTLAYSQIADLGPDEREEYIERVGNALIAEGGRVFIGGEKAKLLNVLRMFLLSETFSYTDQYGVGHVWNVTAAWEIIEKAPREAFGFVPAEHDITLDHIRQRCPELDEEHAMQTDISKPVLFVPFDGACLMIDGWHRLFRAVAEGGKTLPAYLLTDEETAAIATTLEPRQEK